MITSIRCDAVRRAQRASECRVGSAQRKNNVTYAADDVSAVSVEFDVLIFANDGEAKLLDGDEVAVSNDLCSNCIGDYCDPGGWVGCKAYAERRHRGEHRGEVGDNDNFARELVIEVVGKATNHEEDKDCPQEAIIAKKAQELISCHVFADSLATVSPTRQPMVAVSTAPPSFKRAATELMPASRTIPPLRAVGISVLSFFDKPVAPSMMNSNPSSS